MYITNNGLTDQFFQYLCNSIPQVKNKINELTKTNSTNDDWREFCKEAQKSSGELNIDYIYFDDEGEEHDCSVCMGYDTKSKQYVIWIEID